MVDIPRRTLFRASEVCAIAQLQPYVLRTWESEFPDLGVSRTKGGPRTYRRVDVERVLQIKHLLFEEGLTLAGARRKLEEVTRPAETDEAPTLEQLVNQDVQERLVEIKNGLRSILELLSADGRSSTELRPASSSKAQPASARHVARRVKPRSGRASKGGRRLARA